MIAAWAKQIDVPVSRLTGGNRQNLHLKHGNMMVAHIRTIAELAKKAEAHSGFQGFFATVLPGPRTQRDKVVWIPRRSGESTEDYFRST